LFGESIKEDFLGCKMGAKSRGFEAEKGDSVPLIAP
jgi:hypothetical protein